MSVDNNKLHRVLVASFHECWSCAANLKSVFVVAGIIFSCFLEHPTTEMSF